MKTRLGLVCAVVMTSVAAAGCGSEAEIEGEDAHANYLAGQPATDPGGSALPGFSTEFANLNGWDKGLNNPKGGSIGITSHAKSNDNKVLRLRYPGDASLGPADLVGPANGIEVDSQSQFHFGRYEARVRFASCAAGEEVVNGIFTYFNDGTDADGNGITDNSEIDIELLCGEPKYLWLTVWTDYQESPEAVYKTSRVVNMRDGTYVQTKDGEEDTWDLNASGALPNVKITDFPKADTFYRVGFEWQPTFVRYFIEINGKEVELWKLSKAQSIPQTEAYFILNLWHTNRHWMKGGSADYPASNANMLVDWVKITQQ